MSRINKESIEMLLAMHLRKLAKLAMDQKVEDDEWVIRLNRAFAEVDLLEDILALDDDLPKEE